MQFKQQHSIYLQIADYICERILYQEWRENEKISSIRELAVDVAVNPNTVARSYEYLEAQGIIYTQRGLGYFVNTGAIKKVISLKKERFLQEELPIFFKTMQLLRINLSEVQELHDKFNITATAAAAADNRDKGEVADESKQ